jgi:hypothetical protein
MKKYFHLSLAFLSSLIINKAHSKQNTINHRVLETRSRLIEELKKEGSEKNDLINYYSKSILNNQINENSTGLNWHNNPNWNQKFANNGFNDYFNQMPWRSWTKF